MPRKADRAYQFVKAVDQHHLNMGKRLESEALLISVSIEILKAHLGKNWVRNVCRPQPRENDYFRASSHEPHERRIASMRFAQAAECIFNFRDDPEFEALTKRVKRVSHETAIAELQGLCLLRDAGLEATAKSPEGKGGHDYDFIVKHDAEVIACEVESKLETSLLSERSVAGAIRRAYHQLPENSAGMIMLCVPYSWGTRSELEQLFIARAADAIRRKPNLRSISVFWQTLVETPDRRWRFGSATTIISPR